MNNEARKFISDLIEFNGLEFYEEISPSDLNHVCSLLLDDDKHYDWMESLCDDNFKKLVITALKCSEPIPAFDLAEDIQKRISDFYKDDIKSIIEDMVDRSNERDNPWAQGV